MLTGVNFPLDPYTVEKAGGLLSLRRTVERLGLDGVEGIWSGEAIPSDFPADLLTGYHLTFFPEWLDLYRGDMDKVYAHFGNDENLKTAFCYGNPDLPVPDDFSTAGADLLLAAYQKDLERALSLDPAYLVFHVSDVSMEENFTYRWLHTDEEVIDASAVLINALLKNTAPTFDFLVENQWWPGFAFTDPALTQRLLEQIEYPRKGILLDTGHLMNTNRKIRNQAEGIAYIKEMLRRHGSLCAMIRGMHFHQSVSYQYANTHLGALPGDFPPVADYCGQLAATYAHILKLDRHNPWTNPACAELLDLVQPDYLTHEMSGAVKRKFAKVKRQLTTIKKGQPASSL